VIKTAKVKMTGILGILFMLIAFGISSRVDAAQANGGYDSPFLQADYLQELSDWSSGLVNPALLYRINQLHLGFNTYRWSALSTDAALGFGNLSFFAPIRRNHTLGLTVVGAGLGAGAKVQTTTIDASGSLQTGDFTQFYDFWLVGSYAVRMPLPWVMLGINAKVRMQRPFDEDLQFGTPGFDLGLYLNPFDHYRFGDLGISLNFQDIIPSKVTWETSGGVQYATTRLRGGIRYAGLNDRLIFDAESVIDNAFIGIMKNILNLEEDWVQIGGYDSSNQASFGAIESADTNSIGDTVIVYTNLGYRLDYNAKTVSKKDFTLENITSRISAHFRLQLIPQFWLRFGWNNNNIPYVGLHFDIIYLLPEMINYLNVDAAVGYSFIENLDAGGIGDERGFTLALKVATDFGHTREQRESKRLYDRLILAPMDAYNEAMRLYTAGKYWEASFAFGKVLSLFPNFHLNDKASFYMGDCYHKLHLNSIARDVFKQSLEEYTTSEMRAKYLYGLQRLDYREGRYDDALKNHAFIINLYAESDIRPDADYLAGQIHFERKNYNVAEQLLSSVKPGSASYLYAQYTLAIINIQLGKNAQAYNTLRTVVADTTTDPAEQLLQDGANLKLGHLYFEEGDKLRQAVEAYSRVSENSPYYDEALLGMGWAWIKVNKPEICLQTIDQLILRYPKSPLFAEANLVRGYALMLLRRYSDAVSALERCIDFTKKDYVSQDDLARKKSEFERYVQAFQPTAQAIKKNAERKPSSRTMQERPQLESEYAKFENKNESYFTYSLLAKSHQRFFMEKERVLEDAEYALAKATSMLKSKRISEEAQEVKERGEEYDDEIQKLQQELENLE